LKLVRFRVTSFRSVEDSGWVEVNNVTALIGTNESGKTNILLPLWKLNPAKHGAIHPTSDYPRKLYNTIRNQELKPVFIEAIFDLGDELAQHIATKTGFPADQVREVKVSRRFQGDPVVDFPNAVPPRSAPNDRTVDLIDLAQSEISALTALKSEEALKGTVQAALTTARTNAASSPEIDVAGIDRLLQGFSTVNTSGAPATGMIVPRFQRVSDELRSIRAELSREHPRDVDAAVKPVLEKLPKFVYYSTYGNLDSEIYLPHVIQNMARNDLGPREEAKVRTLKVLFEFVRLQPQEILELGRDFRDPANPNRQPNEAEIAEIAEKKKQRSILLQSASALLTSEFRAWWKQGEYRFRFEADGDHFRIWVSDDKRPEEIELEGRSTGLQWFLSFYLVFLVESMDAHEGAILLLDEPGISLHPLAQRDLSAFFDGLAETNQLLYTSHSPFLIDADRLDRARKVYVDQNGASKVTADLRTPAGDASQRGAGYAVHAALGLTVRAG
jgi:energy-coupling factor transporter ATP-binding protein EcfA2